MFPISHLGMPHVNEYIRTNVKQKKGEVQGGGHTVFAGEEKGMDIVDGSCRRREEGGDQSEGCLCVASRPSLECGRAYFQREGCLNGRQRGAEKR